MSRYPTRAQGTLTLRYEDVVQDGRVRLDAMTAGLGVVWQHAILDNPIYDVCRQEQILPILVRLVVEGGPGPFAIENPVEVDGAFAISRTLDEGGATSRLLLTITTDLAAPLGRTHLPPPDRAGERAPLGRVVAHHVFTRPFAPPDQRKVSRLMVGGADVADTAPVVEWAPPSGLLAVPEGAKPLDDLALDPAPIVLGTAHTDSNQHVNSLVYPRLFEEAALRRFAALGRSSQVLARSLDVRFRKPSFQGDRLDLVLRAYERDGRAGAYGAFIEPGTEPSSARVLLRMELE